MEKQGIKPMPLYINNFKNTIINYNVGIVIIISKL